MKVDLTQRTIRWQITNLKRSRDKINYPNKNMNRLNFKIQNLTKANTDNAMKSNVPG